MAAVTFDTLAYSGQMQKAGFTREQADTMARANAEAMRNIINVNELVTKKDLEIALTNNKHDILKWVFGMMTVQTTLIIMAFGIGISLLK